MITQVLVLNGPNLGRHGVREPEVYGSASFEDLAELCLAPAWSPTSWRAPTRP